MKLKKPGQRIFKTALAVFLSFTFSHFRSADALPFYSAIAAIICTKNDVNESIEIGLNRILGTFIGGFVGFLYLLFVKKNLTNEIENYFFIIGNYGFFDLDSFFYGKTKRHFNNVHSPSFGFYKSCWRKFWSNRFCGK